MGHGEAPFEPHLSDVAEAELVAQPPEHGEQPRLVQSVHEMLFRNPLESIEGVEGLGDGTGEIHDDAFRVLFGGGFDELIDNQSGAVVHVRGL